MDEGFELFKECLQNLNDPQKVNEANQKLNYLSLNNTSLFLTYAARVILNFCSQNQDNLQSENMVIASLAAIRNSCTPKRITSIDDIKKYYFLNDPISNQMRQLIREAISKSIYCPLIRVRKMACAALASLLQIEGTGWSEIIPSILSTTSKTDPFNLGSIMIFNEIFVLNVIPEQIPFKSISRDSYIVLLNIIFNIFTCSNQELISQSNKIDASFCLQNLIMKGSDTLFTSEIIDKILSIIFSIFQNDTSLTCDLYRSFHYVMVEIIKSLYIHAPDFCDKIYQITEVGINCSNIDFKIISYHFWYVIWKEERKHPNDKNYLNIIGRYSAPLINYGIKLIASIDPSVKYTMGDNEFQSVEFVCETLSRLFETLNYTDTFVTTVFENIKKVIEEFKSATKERNGDSYTIQHYTAILVMRALLFDYDTIYVFDYIQANLQFITNCAKSQKLYLSEASLKLLTRFSDRYKLILTDPQNINSIFQVIQVCSTFPNVVAAKDFELIYTFCKRLPPELLDNSNFDNLFMILSQKFADYTLLDSPYVENLHLAMENLIFKSGPNSQVKLMQLLARCIQIFKEALASSSCGFVTPFVFASSGINKENQNSNSTFAINKDIEFLLRIITLIIRKLPIANIQEAITEVLNILFRVIHNKSSFLFEDSLGAIIDIADNIKYNFLPYAQQYVEIINGCFFSQNLDYIQTSALCFGNLCEYIGDKIGMYVKDVVMNLFNMMTSLDEFNQMKIIDLLLIAFSKIVTGLKKFILSDLEFLFNLFNFAISLSNFRINLNDPNEFEFAEKLYRSLCLLFISIFTILPDEILLDNKFLRINIKQKFFPFFEKIEKLHSVDLDMLLKAFELLENIAKRAGKKLNTFYHKEYVIKLYSWTVSKRINHPKVNYISEVYKYICSL